MEKVDPIVVSIHIPKCGGTSIGKMLESKFNTLFVYQGRTVGKFVIASRYDDIIGQIKLGREYTINEAMYHAYKFDCTHIHGNIPIDYLMPYLKSIRLITFVREPKERLHSEFCHNVLRFGMDFTEPEFYRYFNNGLYYYTRGVWNLFEFIGRFERFSEDVAKLGLVELHENNAPKEKPPVGYPEELNKYTSIDQEIYASVPT